MENVVAAKQPGIIASNTLDSLLAIIRIWATQYLLEFKFSGSYAKGTAVAGSSDVDLLISLRNDVLTGNTPTLSTLYDSLNARLGASGYSTRLQNVSIGVIHGGISVDLVPAVKQQGNTNDHSLFKRKANSWTKTNVDTHINKVKNSGRLLDIKAVKIWRNLHQLDISSFYLELVVLEALSGKSLYSPASNFLAVMEFLENQFVWRNFIDPANTANMISEELTTQQRQLIATQARTSRGEPNWGQIIW